MSDNQSVDTSWRLDGSTLTIRIPMKLRRRAGRKRIIAPSDSEVWAPAPPKPYGTLIRALGRAHRWRRLLDDGTYATIAELCHAEKITDSYVSRILQLTLLAPEIVEEQLNGRTDSELTLAGIGSVPPIWGNQREALLSGAER